MIPYGKQEILTEDIQAVEKVLKADFLTQGPEVHSFEKKLCGLRWVKIRCSCFKWNRGIAFKHISLGNFSGEKSNHVTHHIRSLCQ